MTADRLRTLLATGVIAAALAGSTPARAQMTVFDPSNYSQNVLTAARTLQQVNNGIQSLQNEATSLLNQARNLASLPYSSLTQLQQSIGQTQQLLGQAQRIAYDVTSIDQAFSRTYPQNYSSSTSSPQLLADAQARWQNSLAGFQDAWLRQSFAEILHDEIPTDTINRLLDAVAEVMLGTNLTLDVGVDREHRFAPWSMDELRAHFVPRIAKWNARSDRIRETRPKSTLKGDPEKAHPKF